MPSVELIVPWRPGCPHREAAWAWCRSRWLSEGWTVTEAPGPDLWCKAAAVMPVIAKSTADVVAVVDADVWTPGLRAAVDALSGPEPFGWAVPHRKVHRIDQDGTRAVYEGVEPAGQRCEERPYFGVIGGGIVVAPREALLEVPLDPRFVGWGQEDESWGAALACLAGRFYRGSAPLFHLWHPPQPRTTRKHGSPESRRLARRYRLAQPEPAVMRALLEEIP